MNTILILYPHKFLSQTKFDRKVSNITSRMEEYCIVFYSDPNDFIAGYSKLRSVQAVQVDKEIYKDADLTHVIIFDDGEEFVDEGTKFETLKIPLRVVKISITRVINIKKDLQFAGIKSNAVYEYIGRGSYWGNPYSMFAEGDSRDEVIRKYKYDFDEEKFAKKEKKEVFKLAGKRLGCFCKPDACHGDVLADFLNKWDDGE
jgi:hypothetical protein